MSPFDLVAGKHSVLNFRAYKRVASVTVVTDRNLLLQISSKEREHGRTEEDQEVF